MVNHALLCSSRYHCTLQQVLDGLGLPAPAAPDSPERGADLGIGLFWPAAARGHYW